MARTNIEIGPHHAWRLFRSLRRTGITVRGAIDCIIAQTCLDLEAELLSPDADFEHIARHTSLRHSPVRFLEASDLRIDHAPRAGDDAERYHRGFTGRSDMHLRLVVHGKAAARPELREAVATARDKGHKITVQPTWEEGDAIRFAQRAVLDGVDVVVAGGGDGTINEVAFGLISASAGPSGRPSLGIVPLGTANDFARSAGIPLETPAALDLVISRPATLVDLGRIGDRIFLNVATGGFGTQVTVETPQAMKKALGGAAYLVTGMTQFSSIGAAHARFTGPDFEWDGNFVVLAIGNGRQAGGGNVLCPEATIDDGLLDVRILPEVAKDVLGETMGNILREGLDAVERMVVNSRTTSLDIEADDDIFINLDGEPISGKRFHVEILPKAVQLHLPETCPLL